jgi:alpha/beta superfamily hydrolase
MVNDMEAVTFPNRAGERLFGILHRPEQDRYRGAAVVILSPGIKSRVAPHRLYVKLARRLCAQGFLVLRFDFYGLGDSEGNVNERLVADLYGSIQAGRYTDDTVAAMDWLQQTHGVSSVALTGLCGGAITGMFAGARDARVRALIGLGIPVLLDSSKALRENFLTANELEYFGKKYLRRMTSVKSWIRLFTFQSDYKVLFRSLKAYAKKFITPKKTPSPAATPPTAAPASDADNMENFNPHFPPAFLSMLAHGRNIFLAFGEADRLRWQFEEKFYSRHAAEIAKRPGRYELYLVKGARHIFEDAPHQDDVFGRIEYWLKNEFDPAEGELSRRSAA